MLENGWNYEPVIKVWNNPGFMNSTDYWVRNPELWLWRNLWKVLNTGMNN